jgi:hypothetical protein
MPIAAMSVLILLGVILARHSLGRGGICVAIGVSVGIVSFAASKSANPAEKPPIGPSTALGYVSSSACRGCHPGEHASFGRTFHRTMTQAATPQAIRAPLEGGPLERRNDEVWATLPDPDRVIEGLPAPNVTRRVVLTTGSHREQAFWVAGRRHGDLRLVPFVWLIEEQTFLPRRDAFLQPPDAPAAPIRWASSCIACHAVAGEPRHELATDTFDTRAAELGIACEACHGPGGAHVERHRDPVERYLQHTSKRADPTIIHPKRLTPERSAALCGQCHAYAFPRDESSWWTEGYSRTFRAGDALEPSRTLIDPITLAKPGAPVVEAPVSALFWSDGSVRVGGREYAGLVRSPCYERGTGDRKMTCLSCHSMHAGDPAGQIAPDHAGNAACTSCHADTKEHSHHRAGSEGSACVSCHMPKTSYALLRAVRSHRIESPSVERTLATGRPNACNLCHLDRSLEWTSSWLSAWYGRASSSIPEARANIAAGVYDGLAGDAAVRALIADASRDRALLEAMKDDPYAAVRFIAARSFARSPATSSAIESTVHRRLAANRDDTDVTIAE